MPFQCSGPDFESSYMLSFLGGSHFKSLFFRRSTSALVINSFRPPGRNALINPCLINRRICRADKPIAELASWIVKGGKDSMAIMCHSVAVPAEKRSVTGLKGQFLELFLTEHDDDAVVLCSHTS